MSTERWAGARAMATIGVVHTALFGSIWLAALLVYAAVFPVEVDATWFAIDAGIVALGVGVVYRGRAWLGFSSLGAHRGWKLLAIAAVGIGAVLMCQLRYADANGVWLDESHYLLTVREGRIIRDGLLPFNLRWLVPFFAGPWNFFPVADMDAVKAINFGAFAVCGAGLVLLLVRLRVPLWLAIFAPLFLLTSYLGTYGAWNRLVLDPANYALFVLLFHTLMRREHWPLFGAVLFVDALNAEKAIYWVPVFAIVQVLRCPWPWRRRDLLEAGRVTLYCTGPTLLYFAALSQYVSGSSLEANLCFENLHMMSFGEYGGKITENVRQNGFRILWFPFGAFTVYALLGFQLAERWMKPVLLLLLPIFTQALVACDTQRMVAYTFVVYLPFGYLYLARALTAMPRALAGTLFGCSVALAVLKHYLGTLLKALRLGSELETARLFVSGFEVVLVGAIVFVHFTFFAERGAGAPAGARDGARDGAGGEAA